jgi:hypothetical protein
MSFFQKAQGFHSEIEDFLLELNRMENQLSASKPTGGLPETAREQLDTHMVTVSSNGTKAFSSLSERLISWESAMLVS